MSPLNRRAFLAVAGSVAGAVVGGCDGSSAPSPDAPTSAGTPTRTGVPPVEPGFPDDELVAAAVASHRRLQASYRGLTRAHPSTGPQVEMLVGHLDEHLVALGEQPSAPNRAVRAPRSRTQALAVVRDAEAAAGADRATECLRAESGELARALASVAGCHAQHVEVLAGLLGPAR